MDTKYAAGLFDGEGSFMIRREETRRGWRYKCLAELTIREKCIPEALQRKYGGTVIQVTAESPGGWVGSYWRWRVFGIDAVAFARDVRKHMRLKRRHAGVVIAFHRASRGPSLDRSVQYNCYRTIAALNRRGKQKVGSA